MMKAYVTWVDSMDTSEMIDVNGHSLQFGGHGDGFCYEHQSFDCYDALTEEEWLAIGEAEPFDDSPLSQV